MPKTTARTNSLARVRPVAMRTIAPVVTVVAGAIGFAAPAAPAATTTAPVTIASVSSSGIPADALTTSGILADNGKLAIFSSSADNLVPGFDSGLQNIYIHNFTTSETSVVSVGRHRAPPNAGSTDPTADDSGGLIAFVSDATNLVGRDTHGVANIFVYNRLTGSTRLVTKNADGAPANGDCLTPIMTGNGRYIVYLSKATNLVDGITNGTFNVLVTDLTTGRTVQGNLAYDGKQPDGVSTGASISADGRYVAFTSLADNLVPNGNNLGNVFVRDLVKNTTTQVSVSSAGIPGNNLSVGTSISPDGRYVGFATHATNLFPGDNNGTDSDSVVHDMVTGQTFLIGVGTDGAQADLGSTWTGYSGDGYGEFMSNATNLSNASTNGFWNVYIRNTGTGVTALASSDANGNPGNGDSWFPAGTPDHEQVGFISFATNLVPGDTTNAPEMYVRDLSDLGLSG